MIRIILRKCSDGTNKRGKIGRRRLTNRRRPKEPGRGSMGAPAARISHALPITKLYSTTATVPAAATSHTGAATDVDSQTLIRISNPVSHFERDG